MKGIPTLWKLRQERQITDTHVALYFWLRHLADEGRIVTSTKLQAADRDVTDRWMKQLLNDLQEHGLIEITHNEKGKKQFVVEVTTGKENQKNFQESQSDKSKSRNSNGENKSNKKTNKVSKKVQQKQNATTKSQNLNAIPQTIEKVVQREIKHLGEKVGSENGSTVTILTSDFSTQLPEIVDDAKNSLLLGSESFLYRKDSSSLEGMAALGGLAIPPKGGEEEEATDPEEARLCFFNEMHRILKGDV